MKTKKGTRVESADYARLGEAVKERRAELGMTQQDAAAMSERIDREVFRSKRKTLGVSRSTWAYIEQGEERRRYPHTLELVDATLRWPQGTARAILFDLELPTGAPVDVSGVTGHSNGHSVDDTAARVETARALRDVADLRYEVAQLAETVARLVREIEGRGK